MNQLSGVKEYITMGCTVTNHFPVDYKGNQHIDCYHCRFYSHAGFVCKLNNRIPEFPDKFIGSECPLMPMENE